MLAGGPPRVHHGAMTGLLIGAPVARDRAIEPDAGRLNWLRAGVLGANDGIVSVAAIVLGVAGATGQSRAIALAGLAALIGGALSMALGEYVSVSSQRDSQLAARGRIGDEANPWSAAAASALSFVTGGVLPLLAVLALPGAMRIPATVAVALLALAGTGAAGAALGGAPAGRATVRVVVGGSIALLISFGLGHLLGTAGIA